MSDVEHPVGMFIAATAELVVVVAVVLLMIFAFAVLLYLCYKRYRGAVPNLAFSADQEIAPPVPTSGLDSASIKVLPLVVFSSEEFKSSFDCIICLSEISDGEEVRMLPRCSHVFHVECIDMWLSSNSTCPLCRCPVMAESSKSPESGHPEVDPAIRYSSETPNLPTNMMFLGSQDRVGGVMVIEIPRRVVEEAPVDEIKSPTLRRIRSLRSILSRGSRGVQIQIGSSCRQRGDDIELGNGVVGQSSASMPRTSMNSSTESSN